MITVDTRGTTAYSPLIPAIKAMCNAVPGETLETHHEPCRRISGFKRISVRAKHRLS